MTRVFPVILTPAKCGYVVSVPDLEINTQGSSIANAIFMARDAIGLWGICEQDAMRDIPEPSTTEPAREPDELISWVDINFDEYRRMHDNSTVHFNISLPT